MRNKLLQYLQIIGSQLRHGVNWETISAEWDNGAKPTVKEAQDTGASYIQHYIFELEDGIEEAKTMLHDIKTMSQKKFNQKYDQ